MSVEQGHNPQEMRDVWSWALSWLLRSTAPTDRRQKQRALVESIHDRLRLVNSVPELHELYTQDSRWCIHLSKNLYPTDWASLGVHATSAAAFGLRYVELTTGKEFDATKHLPGWLSEWAVW